MDIKSVFKPHSKKLNKGCKHFKRTIYASSKDGFSLTIQVGNRDHMHDFQPRVFNGVNLFDKYHNRQSIESGDLIIEAYNLWKDENVNR